MMSALLVPALLCTAVLGAAGEDAPSPGAPATSPRLEAGALHLALATPLPAAAGALALDLGTGAEAAGPADAERAHRLRTWGRVLRYGTGAALVVTSALGTIAAINQPTRFGDGRCITGNPVLGDYGCNRGLSTLHGSSAVVSLIFYTASSVLSLSVPEAAPRVSEGARPWYRALMGVTLGGIVIQPVLGIVAAFPQVVGREDTVSTDTFPRNLRTAHIFIGYITTAAYLTALALEQ